MGQSCSELLAKRDEDLYQTARLVTRGLYTRIVCTDYFRMVADTLSKATAVEVNSASFSTQFQLPSSGRRTCSSLRRKATGDFGDAELVKILKEATEDSAAPLVSSQIPVSVKTIDVLNRNMVTDCTPDKLTAFGYKEISSDPSVAEGGVVYKLLMRALRRSALHAFRIC